MDYKKAYKVLFNAITDSLVALEKERMTSPEIEQTKKLLVHAQQETEELYISSDKTRLKPPDSDK
jgi:hypothetical protein